MKVRVISYDDYAEWVEENKGKGITKLTDVDFMDIYTKYSDDSWEFNSLQEFADEFNTDGAYAPVPSDNLIRFFTNE